MKTKYQFDKKTGYYYTYLPTDELYTNGKPKYKKIRGKTIAKVDERIREYEENKRLNINPSNITVDEWYDLWFSSYKSGKSINTQNFYKNLYKKHIKPVVGNNRLNKVSELNCSMILQGMAANGYAQRTIKGVRSILFSLFDKARTNHYIYTNPAYKLDSKSGKPKKERRELTEEERAKYLEGCKALKYDFGIFLYFFGLRRGEALALTDKDIKKDEIIINKQIIYPDNNKPVLSQITKTEAGMRTIPIPNKAREYFDFENVKKGYLFGASPTEPVTYSVHKKEWQKFINQTFGKDTDITAHYLRHNYCTILFEANVDMLTVKTLAGHKDIKTTLEIYTHYSERLKSKNTDKVLCIG